MHVLLLLLLLHNMLPGASVRVVERGEHMVDQYAIKFMPAGPVLPAACSLTHAVAAELLLQHLPCWLFACSAAANALRSCCA
jgi:hypothetical protein